MTLDEFFKEFLDLVEGDVYYWGSCKLEPDRDNLRTRLEGLAFSILNALDERYAVIPIMEDGSVKKKLDIAGGLHEIFAQTRCKDWDEYIEKARKAGAI